VVKEDGKQLPKIEVETNDGEPTKLQKHPRRERKERVAYQGRQDRSLLKPNAM